MSSGTFQLHAGDQMVVTFGDFRIPNRYHFRGRGHESDSHDLLNGFDSVEDVIRCVAATTGFSVKSRLTDDPYFYKELVVTFG